MMTRITGLLGISYPILQGGLQHLAVPGLCAAVSNAGGLGQLSAAVYRKAEEFAEAIQETRALTERPFGVNVVIGTRPLEDHLAAAIDARVPVYTFTGGNPGPFLKQTEGLGARRLVLVAAVRQAQKAEALGADAVIAVGHEGGGNVGREQVSTLALVPRVVDAVMVPVVASGAISDARGFAAALALGADGIEMGTRFVAVQESPAHPAYKQALVEAAETDTTLIRASIGRPGRVLRGPWVERILECEGGGGQVDALLPLISGEVNWRGAREGDLEHSFLWCGQGVGLIRDVPTTAELMERLVAGAAAIARGLPERFSGEASPPAR